MKPTKTTNRLHFSDLDPMRFEDLCLNLVSRIDDWKELNHFGRKGSDLGVDILAIQKDDVQEKVWYIRCKRYSSITKNNLSEIIDKVIENPALPDKLLIIVSCDVSRILYQYLKEYSTEKGINEVELWTASVLEVKLYKDYKDLLFVYFGIRIENKTQNNVAKIKQSLRMKKKVSKELIDHNALNKRHFTLFLYEPYYKFITREVYIRSIDDTSYPDVDVSSIGISSWFKTYFYDLYHNGIEFWLDVGKGTIVIIDGNGYWEPVSCYDERINNSQFKVVDAMLIGRIPYHNIVDFIVDGDEYFSKPHLFCKFDMDSMPYEEIYYKSLGNQKKEIPNRDFDKSKRTVFNKSDERK